MRRFLGVLTAVMLAGCFAANEGSQPRGAPGTDGTATGSADVDAGGILATVLTDEQIPVEGAEVALFGTDLAALTDANGSARFEGLAAGTYTVLTAKPGHQAAQPQGRVVEVAPGETTPVRLTLNPVETISGGAAYHETFPFVGFLGCSVAGAPGTVGYTSYCSKGVTVAGQGVRDPNDNSSHSWDVDSITIQGLVMEMREDKTNNQRGVRLTVLYWSNDN